MTGIADPDQPPAAAPAQPALLSAALEEVPEAVLLVDGRELVRYANGRVRDPYGVDPADTVGRPLAELLTLPAFLLGIEDRQDFLQAVLAALGAPDERHARLFRRTDGSTYLQRIVPARVPGAGHRLVITTNVTGLRARNRTLEVEAGAPRAEQPRPALRLLRGGRDDHRDAPAG